MSLTGLILLVLFDPIISMSLAALKNVKDLRGQQVHCTCTCTLSVWCAERVLFCGPFLDLTRSFRWFPLSLVIVSIYPSVLSALPTDVACRPLSCRLHPIDQWISCVHFAHLPLWNLFADFLVVICYLLKCFFMSFSFLGCVKVISSHQNLGQCTVFS